MSDELFKAVRKTAEQLILAGELDDVIARRISKGGMSRTLLDALGKHGLTQLSEEWRVVNGTEVPGGLVTLARTYEREGYDTLFHLAAGEMRVRLLVRPRADAPPPEPIPTP